MSEENLYQFAYEGVLRKYSDAKAKLDQLKPENAQLKQRLVELEELVARSNGANTEDGYKQRITELEELVTGLNGVRVSLEDKTAEASGLMQRVAELEQHIMQLRAQQAQTQANNASDRNDEMDM